MGAVIILAGVALMIVIHEGAHFVAAKGFGMKATEAFFGFGPKLWSTRRGETEYGIKAIPFGGYVRIIGMNPFEEVPSEDEARTYRMAPFWKKSVVVLAGIASHLVMALLIFVVVAMAWGVVSTDEDGNALPTTTLAQVAETLPELKSWEQTSSIQYGSLEMPVSRRTAATRSTARTVKPVLSIIHGSHI